MAKTAALEGFATDWRRLKGGRYVAVDSDPSGAALTLSHHFGGNATPPTFRDDLAAGAALKWAASPERESALGGAKWVYNDHFDVDGFLAAWVVLNPDEALTLRDEILAAAASGDFDEWTNERAVQLAIMGEWIDDPKFSRVARETLKVRDASRGDALYEGVMAELPELLRHPERLEELWRRPFLEVKAQVDLIDRGKARVEERAGSHLSVVRAPRQLLGRAVVARTRGDRLLQAVELDTGFLYQFRYRPYLGYRIVSRATTPVHEMDALARELNSRWPTDGETWKARGWWNRELRLTAKRVGRVRLAKTPPEEAVPIFEDAMRSLDARNPEATVSY